MTKLFGSHMVGRVLRVATVIALAVSVSGCGVI
jgi:hypothetical protein